MKRKLMTLMFGLLLLFVGSSIAKAEVVNTVPTSAASIAENAISINKMKLSYLSKKCALFDACDNALKNSNLALANANTICERDNWESGACEGALDQAEYAVNNAAERCINQPSQATITRKNIPIFPRENVNKKQEDTSS